MSHLKRLDTADDPPLIILKNRNSDINGDLFVVPVQNPIPDLDNLGAGLHSHPEIAPPLAEFGPEDLITFTAQSLFLRKAGDLLRFFVEAVIFQPMSTVNIPKATLFSIFLLSNSLFINT